MHLMVDFETMGNNPTSIVVSTGACLFNKEGIHRKFLCYNDIYEQQLAGRTWTASTLGWWMQQKDEARKVFYDNKLGKLKFADFFNEFEKFIDEGLEEELESRDELKAWSNGADFDLVILKDIYTKHHPRGEHGVPWKFWNGRCFRMFNAMTNIKKKHRMKGAAHNALDDAIYQAQCVIKVLNQGGKK